MRNQLFVNGGLAIPKGGFQSSGPLSPFDEFTLSVTARSWGFVRSLAKARRSSVVQLAAPDYETVNIPLIEIKTGIYFTFQAFDNGTM